MVQPGGTEMDINKLLRECGGCGALSFGLQTRYFLVPYSQYASASQIFILPLPSYMIPDFIGISAHFTGIFAIFLPYWFLSSKEFTNQEAVVASLLLSCRVSDSKQNSNVLVPLRPPLSCRGKRAPMTKQPKKRTRWVTLKDSTDTKVSWVLNSG